MKISRQAEFTDKIFYEKLRQLVVLNTFFI